MSKVTPLQVFQWGAAIAGTLTLIKLLHGWGLLGKNDDEKGTEQLYANNAFTGSPKSLNDFKPAIQQKTGKKLVTDADVKSRMPSGSTMLQWKNQLIAARGFWNDDESYVYNVFRGMRNQLSLYAFDQFFKVYTKKSVIDYLDEFMDMEELSRVNDIIAKLPKV